MFKRLLAFVLAGALIFETPATTLAAEQIPVTEQEILPEAEKAEVQDVEESEADIAFALENDETLGTLSVTSTVVADDFNKLTLNATVTGYAGEYTKAYLYYEYTNALGETVKGIGNAATAETEINTGTKKFTLKAEKLNPALEAETKYDITVGVVFANDDPNNPNNPSPDEVNIDDNMLNTTTQIETATAVCDTEHAEFTVEQNAILTDYVDYKVTGVVAVDGNGGATIQGAIYYREEPEPEDPIVKFNGGLSVIFNNGTATGQIVEPYFVEGKTYELVIMVGGVKMTTGYNRPGAEAVVKLTKSTDTADKNSVGAYDVTGTIKATAASGELDAEYTLEMWYMKTGDNADNIAKLGSTTLNSDNGYKAEMNSAEGTVLNPNTSYDFEYRLKAVDVGAAPGYIDTLRENNVTTAAATFTVTKNEADSSHNSYSMDITLTAAEVANLKANNKEITLKAYLKKSSEDDILYADTNESVVFNSNNDYTATLILTGLESGTEYSLILRNADGDNVLIDDTLKFTTDAEPVDIREVTATVNTTSTTATITYNTENATTGYLYCFYRKKANGPDGEWSYADHYSMLNSYYRSGGFNLTGLESETTYEYKLGFYDSVETVSSTADELINSVTGEFTTDVEVEDTRKVTVTVETNPTSATISYTTENAASGYLVCYYKRANAGDDGWLSAGYQSLSDYYYGGNGSFYISELSSETKYDYLVGFGEYFYASAESLINPVTADFTTPADPRKATVVSTATKVTEASFDVTVSDVDDECYVQVNYRKHADTGEAEPWKFGGDTWYEAAASPKCTITISGLTPNTKYDYQVGIKDYDDGDVEGLINPTEVKDSTTFTTKEDNRTITATAKATVTSVIIDYTVGGSFSEEDRLDFYYKEKDSGTWLDTDDYYYLNEQIKLTDLTPGKTYEFVIGFKGWASNAAELKALDKSAKAEFSLAAEDREITSTATAKVTSVVINYTVSGTIAEDDSVVGFYRDANIEEAWKSMNYYHNSNSKSFTISGLSAGTNYEYVLGFSDWASSGSGLIESGKTEKKTFSTLADDRKITAAHTAKVTEAVINCTVSGAVSEGDYIIGYYKLKDVEDIWHDMYLEYDADYAFELSGLTPNTNYSYVIGFRDWANTGDALAASDKAVKSDFKTTEDNRRVEATVESRVKKAVVSYTLSGDYSDSDTVRFYYKEDGADSSYSYRSLTITTKGTYTIPSLTPGTKYSYKIGFGTGVNELTGSAEGEFTTLEDQRTLSDPSVEVITAGTYPQANISLLFSGNIDNQTTYIHYLYKAKEASDWSRAYYTTTTSYIVRNLSQTITITGDNVWGKKYDYAVVISDSLAQPNPDAADIKAGMKVTGEFDIPEKEAATAIRLSQDKMYLNLGSVYSEGYRYQTLSASLTPSTAQEDLVWQIKDNSNVVMLTGTGAATRRVLANRAGNATIVVSVAGKPEIKAECEVEVADYRIYAVSNGEKEKLSQVSYFNDCQSTETYHLYKYENGAETEVTDYKVTSDNATIVKWNDAEKKLIIGKATGTANLTFTAGDFKALLIVDSYSQAQNLYITDFETNNPSYEAINNGDGFTLACSAGLSYEAVVDEDALYPFSDTLLKWSTENTDIINVDSDSGIVTPLKSGDATLKVTTTIKINNTDKPLTAEVKLHIVNIPTRPSGEVYALANITTKLGDVACPDGWEWKYPDTPIVVNGNYDTMDFTYNAYNFEAVCTDGYPSETTICVNMAKVTGVSVYNESDAIVEVGETAGTEDSIDLTISTRYQGKFYYNQNNNNYNEYEIYIPEVKDLTITPGTMDEYGDQVFNIKAAKAGTYTIKPVIRVKDSKSKNGYKELAKTTYKFKAVSGTNAELITLELADDSKGVVTKEDGTYYIDLYSENEVGGVKPAASTTTFGVKAILKDRTDAKTPYINASTTSDSLKSTKLTWKSSDAKVLKVAATSDAHAANVTVNGEGHAILTATAKDAAGHSGTLNIEIRNHAPRVSASKVTVNKAYDYTTSAGKNLAYNSLGGVEIVPVYGEYISKVRVYKGDAESSDLRAYEYEDDSDTYYGDQYVIAPKNNSAASGQYELRVTTNKNKTYKYPIKVTVVDKAPKVTIKSNNTVNLFYTEARPEITVKVSETNATISSVKWKDKTAAAGDGFSSDWTVDSNNDYIYRGSTENIKLKNNKPESNDIAKGTFTVKINGYRQTCEVPATIKFNYKKPAIVSQNASTILNPSLGQNSSEFRLYNKTEKTWPSVSSIICQNKNATISNSGSWVSYTYTGIKSSGSVKLELKLMSASWREPVIVNHTIKLAKPAVVLTSPQLVFNTNEMGTAYTYVYTKNAGTYINCDNIAVEGKDAKSINLLADGQLEITTPYADTIAVTQKRTDKAIAPGTYSYKVTPYYKDAQGKATVLKTLVLKVKVVNKAVTAKVKTKNTLDLLKGASSSRNSIELTSTFANLGSGYDIDSINLVGEYSEYFALSRYRYSGEDGEYHYTGNAKLYISSEGIYKLKAGQKYKLALEYTITMPYGDTFTVTSAAFTVAPKQSVPKVTVHNNNQTLYVGRGGYYSSRTYKFTTAEYKYKNGNTTYTANYTIIGAYGGIDCNKDGRYDIFVDSYDGGNAGYIYADVYMTDPDAVLTATGAKGKTYSIPVTVTLRGRDGISKDVKTTVKVTVKR